MAFSRIKPLPPPSTVATVTFTYEIVDDDYYIALWRWWIGFLANPDSYTDDTSPIADCAATFGDVTNSETVS